MTKRIFVAGQLMDNNRLRSLGWELWYTLREGLEDAYSWYPENLDTARGGR